MKLLITGATGFLGGRLAKFLLTDPKYQLLLGSRDPNFLVNRYHDAELVETQWYSETELGIICSGVDTIVHLAGMNAGQCANASKDELALDVKATDNLLQAAVKNNVKRFIYMSSAHVYSAVLSGTISELTPTTNMHPYALNHIAKEALVAQTNLRGEIDGIVVRLSNAFGAPENIKANCWMLLVNDLCRQAVNSSKLVLKSTGQQRRDFVSIIDFCLAIKHLIDLPHQELYDGLFNLGGQWTPTVLELTKYIAERYHLLSGINPAVYHEPTTKNTSNTGFYFSIQKLLDTGYRPAPKIKIEREIDSLLSFCLNIQSPCTG